MVEFHFASPSLEGLGPTVEVEIRTSTSLSRALLAQGRPVPPPVPITAIIDTGATWCLLTPDVYRRLGIAPFDVATISTASSVSHEANVYNVDFVFGGQHRVRNIAALEAPLSGVPAQGLIGRNLLAKAVFVYDGRLNRYSLAF